MNNQVMCEVFGMRIKPDDNNKRLAFFKIKLYVGENDWIDIDNFKLQRDLKTSDLYILPPAEKSLLTGKWMSTVFYSDGLRNVILEKATKLYESQRS